MRMRQTSPVQLTFPWQIEDSTWKHVPWEQQERCRELLAQLLQAVAKQQTERSTDHERED